MFNHARLLALYLTSLKSDKRGVTAIEYGLIAGLIALTLITGATALGSGLSTAFSGIGGLLASAASPALG